MRALDLLIPYFRENRTRIAAGMFCLALVDFLQLLIPRVVKYAVDDLTALRADTKSLAEYAAAIVGISLGIGVLRYVWRRCLIGTSRRVEEGLRNRLFAHIQSLSAPFFDRSKSGDLMARATNDIQNIRMATGMGVVALTDAVVMGTAALGFMLVIDVTLTLCVAIPAPLIVLGTRAFSRQLHARYKTVQESFSELTEAVRERLAGIRIVKAYTLEAASLRAVEELSTAYVQKNLHLVRVTRAMFPMMVFFSNLSMVIVLFLGGWRTIGGTLTAGDLVAFISYLGMLTWPMMAMGWVANLIQRGKASLERIHGILEERPDIGELSGAMDEAAAFGDLAFENVSFGFASETGGQARTEANALDNVSFILKPGRFLGIVGPPGSGKSTLLNLIPRIYDPGAGRIRLGGTDIGRWPLKRLRSAIAHVPQEPFLFAGTLAANIALEDAHATEADVMRAVRMAALDTDVAGFPRGLDTVVGERGVILSGGQKQRVALARAFLKDAQLFLLDDPVSQVDAATAGRIVAAIRSTAGRKSVVIVSHRLSALWFADSILVMDRGRVVASGTHEDLMQTDGYYRRTFLLQEIEEAFHVA